MKPKKETTKSKKTEDFTDDGRVIVDMDVEGYSWHRKRREKAKREKARADAPTKKEMFALIIAAYKAYLPYLLIIIGVFIVVFIIGYLMLK